MVSDAFLSGGDAVCKILAPFLSDHRAVQLKSSITLSSRGPGYWKFNNQLLGNEQFVSEARLFLDNAINENRTPTISSILLFETVLCMARGYVIQFASRIKRKRNERLTWLEKHISEAVNVDSHSRGDLNTLIEERDGIIELRARQSMFRCKVNWAAYAEKSSSYFFSLERRKGQQKSINSMVLKHSADGRASSDPRSILDECKHFYSTLYKSQIDQCGNPSDFLQEMSVISHTAKTECDYPVTKQELHTALCALKKNTSPGPCGWTAEFFETFWNELGCLYTAVVHEMFDREVLPPSFTTSITTLIPKKQKDRRMVENLRPISLLPVAYKILAKLLASRIAKVASTLIHADQTGFIKGRYIGENVRMVLDLLKYAENEQLPGLIVQCDYYKAYDCVEWKYINTVMESVGFGPNFLRWIQIFYPWAHASPYHAQIALNNFLSRPYSIERGIRQGCPLSCLVWALCIEPMACKIRSHSGIRGVTVAQEEVKLSLYADDTTIVLDGSEQSLRNSLQLIYSFCNVSGLKLNTSKTICLWIGAKRNSPDRPCREYNLLWTNEAITILGVQISTDLNEIARLNYDNRINVIKRTLTPWLQRSLTPFGRCIIVKNLALSKLTYLFSVLPSPDAQLLRQVERIFFEFIWGSKRDKVRRSVSKNLLVNGGLKAPDVYLYSLSLKTNWIKRWLDPQNSGKWKLFVHNLFSLGDSMNIFECAIDGRMIAEIEADTFWIEVLLAWEKMKPYSDDTVTIMQQPIRFNKHLRLEQQPNLSVNRVQAHGIRRVKYVFSV